MQDQVPDEVLAQHLQSVGLVTPAQILEAQRAQADAARQGSLVPLGDVLELTGVLTSVMRQNIEASLRAQEDARAQQAASPTMFGNYKLLKKLGSGGMGAVYLAEDTHAMRQVALKILPPEAGRDPVMMRRFRQEAIATGKLNHENIVSAYTFDEQDGLYYYAMEYCDGEGLDSVLERQGLLPEADALQIVLQVARGLQHAHSHGIIHRDIKPGNVFITRPGVAKILDLGLSKDMHNTNASFQTLGGWALGTPHYISPEQARAEKDLDGRADIYSLGATFYHLLTGRPPYEGESPAVTMSMHLTQQAPNPLDLNPTLNQALVQILRRMMARSREDRYAHCAELVADLEAIQAGGAPVSAPIADDRTNIAAPRFVPAPGVPLDGPDPNAGAGRSRARRSGLQAGVAAPEASARPAGRRSGVQAGVAASDPPGRSTGRRAAIQADVGSTLESPTRGAVRRGATSRQEPVRGKTSRQEPVAVPRPEHIYPTPPPLRHAGDGDRP
jgi:serine/threonine protein kinase